MSIISRNPYKEYNGLFIEGMDYVIENLPSPCTEDDLKNVVGTFAKDHFGYSSGTISDSELKSIIPFSISAYLNKEIGAFNAQQMYYLYLLFEGIKNTPYEKFREFVINLDNGIAESSLTLQEKAELYLVTMVTDSINAYWDTKITTPGDWEPYFNANSDINRNNKRFWVEAAAQAASYFISKGASEYGIASPPKISGPDIVTSFTAALAIASGKVVFGWLPQIKVIEKLGNLSCLNSFIPISVLNDTENAEGLAWCIYSVTSCALPQGTVKNVHSFCLPKGKCPTKHGCWHNK